MKKTVLIVEDEKSLSNILKKRLVAEGFDVITKFDGKDGLKEALHSKPDCILLDIIMPKKNGIEMLKELRNDPQYGVGAKVIVLTNVVINDSLIREVIELGVTHHLVKSNVKLQLIVDRVKELTA